MAINVPSHKQLRKKNDYQINHTHDAHDHHHHDHDGKRTHYNHTLSQQGRTLRNKKRKQQKMVCPYQYILKDNNENFYVHLNAFPTFFELNIIIKIH